MRRDLTVLANAMAHGEFESGPSMLDGYAALGSAVACQACVGLGWFRSCLIGLGSVELMSVCFGTFVSCCISSLEVDDNYWFRSCGSSFVASEAAMLWSLWRYR
jgi:hypothetical protein